MSVDFYQGNLYFTFATFQGKILYFIVLLFWPVKNINILFPRFFHNTLVKYLDILHWSENQNYKVQDLILKNYQSKV